MSPLVPHNLFTCAKESLLLLRCKITKNHIIIFMRVRRVGLFLCFFDDCQSHTIAADSISRPFSFPFPPQKYPPDTDEYGAWIRHPDFSFLGWAFRKNYDNIWPVTYRKLYEM